MTEEHSSYESTLLDALRADVESGLRLIDRQDERIGRLREVNAQLRAALEGLLSELPELWGDDLRDGAMDLVVGEDDILRALDAIDRAKGPTA